MTWTMSDGVTSPASCSTLGEINREIFGRVSISGDWLNSPFWWWWWCRIYIIPINQSGWRTKDIFIIQCQVCLDRTRMFSPLPPVYRYQITLSSLLSHSFGSLWFSEISWICKWTTVKGLNLLMQWLPTLSNPSIFALQFPEAFITNSAAH